jgi:hypothetical protein
MEQSGMSLRDYFAAAILQGIVAKEGSYGITEETLVNEVWRKADAVLLGREKLQSEVK